MVVPGCRLAHFKEKAASALALVNQKLEREAAKDS
jgi:hypothetical protein